MLVFKIGLQVEQNSQCFHFIVTVRSDPMLDGSEYLPDIVSSDMRRLRGSFSPQDSLVPKR